MDIFTFIFLVVLVGCSIPLLKLWLEGRRAGATDSAESAELRAQIDKLQARVAVLEKIVTDDKYELKRELASLDQQP
jgi:cell division protein FtsB